MARYLGEPWSSFWETHSSDTLDPTPLGLEIPWKCHRAQDTCTSPARTQQGKIAKLSPGALFLGAWGMGGSPQGICKKEELGWRLGPLGHGASEDRKGAPSTPISTDTGQGVGFKGRITAEDTRGSLALFPLCVSLVPGSPEG